ncbi:MAG: glycosyltransferase family 4 protein [Chloroflexaceae bacterium]|nr:glycosyltransferase family 4 protein [Chloroflexaceae bacterium]
MTSPPPVKVAHITAVDSSLHYLLLNQMKYLQQSGYEVVGISAHGPDVRVLEAAGIRHIPVAISRNITPFADLQTLLLLYRVMRREQFTIVHTHTPKPGLLGQLAARMARVPVVINTLHGFYFHEHMPAAQRHFYITLEKVAAQCSDVILSQNREDIQTALREGICKPALIKHLGNGIELARFDPAHVMPAARQHLRAELGIPTDAPVVGFVGRLAARRKGFLDFLAAGQRILQQVPDVHFVIVGTADRGKPDAVHPDAAHEYGIAERCHFVGWKPNSELPALYALMHVLVLPSLFEGVPRTLIEGATMGVPLVATNVKGNREAIEHGTNGFLVPLGDVPELAAAIVKILQHPQQAAHMGQEGRRLALSRFDERNVFEMVRSEYARLLHTKGLPVPAAVLDEPRTHYRLSH